MIIAKVTRVANGKKRATRKKSAVSSRPNAAYLLTLANHKRRSTVKKAKKKYAARNGKKRNASHSHHMKIMAKGRRRGRSRNPQFFGTHAPAVKVGEYVIAGLVGVTINRAALAMLPATVTSNNLYATLAAVGIAVAQWWLGSKFAKDLGSAFGFGGLMNATSQALNAFIPSVGSIVSLQGGVGDFVPAQFTIPPQPAGIGGLASFAGVIN